MLVTKNGYESWRESVFLSETEQVVGVVLKRSIPVPDAVPDPTPQRKTYEPKMVLVSGGCYQMGSPASEEGRDGDERQHRVCVDDVYAATTETTISEFKAFVAATRYRTEAERNVGADGCYSEKNDSEWGYVKGRSWRDPGFKQGDEEPVVCVSWNDAMAYAKWLQEDTGKPYRLPTEAEWEYAARGNTSGARYWGENASQTCSNANVGDATAKQTYSGWTTHSCDDGVLYTAKVGGYSANAYGLYDVLGNVWEWTCSDWDEGYGGAEKVCSDGSNDRRSLRGGSWGDRPAGVRSANRDRNTADYRVDIWGFRLFQDVN